MQKLAVNQDHQQWYSLGQQPISLVSSYVSVKSCNSQLTNESVDSVDSTGIYFGITPVIISKVL